MIVEEVTITCFLRWWSTSVPKNVPNTAVKSMKPPPMIAVAMTERVSR